MTEKTEQNLRVIQEISETRENEVIDQRQSTCQNHRSLYRNIMAVP